MAARRASRPPDGSRRYSGDDIPPRYSSVLCRYSGDNELCAAAALPRLPQQARRRGGALIPMEHAFCWARPCEKVPVLSY
jgi:hypothetical protein